MPSIIFTAPYRVEGDRSTHGSYSKYDRNKFVATMIYCKNTVLTLVNMNDTMTLLKGDFAHV